MNPHYHTLDEREAILKRDANERARQVSPLSHHTHDGKKTTFHYRDGTKRTCSWQDQRFSWE